MIICKGSTIWNEATASVTCFASEAARCAADQPTAAVRGATPFGGEVPSGVRNACTYIMHLINFCY